MPGAVGAASALAACAGAVDLIALSSLGGAFASVITGNLVTIGLGLGTSRAGLIETTVAAVAGYAVGVATWSVALHRRRISLTALLVLEWILLAALAGGWYGSSTHPSSANGRWMLAIAAAAMGGQSVVAQQLRASTTYMTGALTTAVRDLVTGRGRESLDSWRYLGSLIAGAIAAAILLRFARDGLPILPLALLALAIALIGRRATTKT